MAVHVLPDGGKLSRHVSRTLKQPGDFHGTEEDRWFLSHLRDALEMYRKIVPSATLLIIRESWAASPVDSEVVASATIMPPWLNNC